MPKLSRVIAAVDRLYDPTWAENWDAVGLVCGDPDAEVRTVGFAVDPVQAVVGEAVVRGADLLITHHSLYLRGTHSVAATHFKGRVVHTLLTHGCALHVAHTNADSADPGVSDALAAALGLTVTGPLEPAPHPPGSSASGSATPGSRDTSRGIGRVGTLPQPLTLAEFARRAADALPATPGGLRVSGDPNRPVHTVAVCGGAGDGLFPAVRQAGADVYLTADLRHHPASEAREEADGIALVDAAHWATEWPWLNHAAQELATELARCGDSVDTYVSRLPTDPWTFHVAAHR